VKTSFCDVSLLALLASSADVTKCVMCFFISDDSMTLSDSDALRPITALDFEASLEKMRRGGKYVTNVIGFNLD
jgi:hypothetical protein